MIVTIYSIVCKTNPELVYVGSTTLYKQRKWQHTTNAKTSTKTLYELIRSNGGWDNFVMSEIKHVECDTRKQGYEEEDKYMIKMKATMNSNKSAFNADRPHEPKLKKEKKDIKKQREENKDKISEANKKYYQEHKEERKAYRESIAEEQKEYKKKWYEEHRAERIEKNQEEYTCACGKVGKLTNKARHEKTQFHVDFTKAAVLNTTS